MDNKLLIIEHIEANNLSDDEKKLLIRLIKNEQYQEFIAEIVKIVGLSVEILKILGITN